MFGVTKNPTLGATSNTLVLASPVFDDSKPTAPEMKTSPFVKPSETVYCAFANPKANTAATDKITFFMIVIYLNCVANVSNKIF